jgi:hypothetical protein
VPLIIIIIIIKLFLQHMEGIERYTLWRCILDYEPIGRRHGKKVKDS